MKKPMLILSGVLVLGLSAGISTYFAANSDEPNMPVEIDYTNLDSAVVEVLKEMQNASLGAGVNVTAKGLSIEEDQVRKSTVEELLSIEKAKFRLKLENRLLDRDLREKELKGMAEKSVSNLRQALTTASSLYGIEVAQDEVTAYIDENVAIFVNEEKENYATALGLTLYELDYLFDRDFYAMDVLWGKLIPVLMEQHPQRSDETSDSYMQRIKDEFYSHDQ